MQTEAERKSKAKYQKTKPSILVTFYPLDYDLYEFVSKQGKKVTYIKDLIRKDMQK